MHTLETAELSEREQPIHQHRPQTTATEYTSASRRVGIIDRAALRLGMALIVWGRRPVLVEAHEARSNRIENGRARFEREAAAERMRYLGSPRS